MGEQQKKNNKLSFHLKDFWFLIVAILYEI